MADTPKTASSVEPPRAGAQMYEHVERICREIHQRTMFSSRVSTDDPGYAELLALGPDVVPALLRRIEAFHKSGRHYDGMAVWEPIAALYAITKADPVPKEHAGRLGPIIEDWLEWGRQEGHEW